MTFVRNQALAADDLECPVGCKRMTVIYMFKNNFKIFIQMPSAPSNGNSFKSKK
jgi:hypothetical protein